MLKNLFKRKHSLELMNTHEADVALRLMFEIAISDGNLDVSELKLIKKRADEIAFNHVVIKGDGIKSHLHNVVSID